MEKDIIFYPPNLKLGRVLIPSGRFSECVFQFTDYSSCVDGLTAPDFRRYLKKKLPSFAMKLSHASVIIVYIYTFM